MGIEEKLIKEDKNMDDSFRAFIGDKITIIHLFASG